MKIIELLPADVALAMEDLAHSDNPILSLEGFNRLKTIADAGDIFAVACLGYACQFEHFDFYNLNLCKEYLQKAADANNVLGQYYLGSMLYLGERPFKQDKVYGKWLIDQARTAGLDEAIKFWDNIHREMSPAEARELVSKAKLRLFWEAIKKPFSRKD